MVAADTDLAIAQLAAASDLRAVVDSARQLKLTYLDSFDGRLYRDGQGLLVEQEGRRRVLRSPCTAAFVRGGRVPVWAADLPVEFSNLGPLLGCRALLAILHRSVEQLEFRLLDDLDKTIVRIEVLRGQLGATDEHMIDAPQEVRIWSLRGFEQHAQGVARCASAQWAQSRESTNVFADFARYAGIAPKGHRTKLKSVLQRGMRADVALGALLTQMHSAVERTAPGVIARVDTEFLHDLRVAMRRSRAWLGQLREVVLGHLGDPLREELTWLGRQTSELRDLDVYIVMLQDTEVVLPEPERQALAPLHQHLTNARRRAQTKVKQDLSSQRFQALMSAWQALAEQLTHTHDDGAEAAGVPIAKVANRTLRKQWRRLLNNGRRITIDTPPEALHDLRIDCKKLRYLLVAFECMYPRKSMAELIAAVRRLQNTLGAFQDFEIQQTKLREFAYQMTQRKTLAVDTTLAMGRLVEHLHHRQMQARQLFHQRWCELDCAANIALAKTAFSDEAELDELTSPHRNTTEPSIPWSR